MTKELMDYLEDDILQGVNSPKDLMQKVDSYSRIATAYVKEQENALKQEELRIKQEEARLKQEAEEARLRQEAIAARKAFQLEIAKFVLAGATSLFTGSLVAISCAKGDLGFKALKDIRLPFKTL